MVNKMTKEMKKLVERAKKDRNFLNQLLTDPEEATNDIDLSEEERKALGGNTIGRLGTLADAGALVAAGCGSSGTCEQTCTATCTVTFTSIQIGDDVIVNS